MYCVVGVSRCSFLWGLDSYNCMEMRVPLGVLELPRLDIDTREKIQPWIDRGNVPVILKETERSWHGNRDSGHEYDADGDERPRDRSAPYYGARR